MRGATMLVLGAMLLIPVAALWRLDLGAVFLGITVMLSPIRRRSRSGPSCRSL